jgi:molecular chaperone GrpE
MAEENINDSEGQTIENEDIIADLKELLDRSEKEKKDYLNGWQRERADFINYKNKEAERIKELLFSEKEDYFLKILPIIDNFNLAEESIEKDKKQDQNIKGLLMIKNQLEAVLKDQGFEELDRLNKKFNPAWDEVVETVTDSKIETQTIIEVVQKGYCFKNKLLRPAKVKIVE